MLLRFAKDRRPARPTVARKIPQAVRPAPSVVPCCALQRSVACNSQSPTADTVASFCPVPTHDQVGARFYNDYGETLQLFWDAPGPNPRGAFLQGSILPGATLRMKSYVGHAFHAELAGEMVWGQKLNDKARQWYTIDRSQKQETTQDLFAGWSLSGESGGGAAAPPPIGPAADETDGVAPTPAHTRS